MYFARRLSLIFLSTIILAGCTAFHSPDAYLPSRDGITPGETITVQGNQNVYAVARKNNVSMRELIVLNNLQPPFALKPGQTLILPAKAGDLAPTPMAAPSGTIEQSPLSGSDQSAIQSEELPPPPTVAPQTLPPQNIPQTLSPAQPNGLSASPSPGSSRVVSVLPQAPTSLGPPPASHSGLSTSPTAVDALNAPAQAPTPMTTTVASASPAIPRSDIAPAATASAHPSIPDASNEASGPIDMIWPVQGPVLSGFGPKGEGLNNDGVNIGAPKGAPVVAAANGIVVYAGSEMKGFGNLILIRHQGGWVTAYAHLDRTLVSKDAIVAQGDMIATVGKTGNVSSPQLHFEVRHKDKPVDPKDVVKS